MAIICWGNLAKSADSTERIEQAIEGYIESHDENPNAHMGTDYALGAHRLQTLLDHPYGSVKYYHVYDIHAESITAGGIVVKGGGPYISVQDTGGNERVKIYPEGIIVKNGNILVQDYMGRSVFDSKGLVSSNSFTAPVVGGATLNQETSTTADVTGSQMTFKLDRYTVLLFNYYASIRVENDAANYCDAQLGLIVNDADVDIVDIQTIPAGDNSIRTYSGHFFAKFETGTHVVKLKIYINNPEGTPDVLVYRFKVSYVILGS